MEYVKLEITVRERVEVPTGTVVDGDELRLPSGQVLKPWVAYELQSNEHGTERDLTGEELERAGVVLGDIHRSIETI